MMSNKPDPIRDLVTKVGEAIHMSTKEMTEELGIAMYVAVSEWLYDNDLTIKDGQVLPNTKENKT